MQTLLDMFPEARSNRRFSIQGKPASIRQRGFDNKDIELNGSSGGRGESRHIGCVCKKGLKPESPNQDDFLII